TEQLVGEGEISLAEPLGAGLIDAAIAFRSFHYGLAFRNGHARWLFGVNVLSRPHRHYGGQGMPAVAGSDQERVYIRALGQEFRRVVVYDAILVAVPGVHDLLDGLGTFGLWVAHCDKLYVLLRHHPLQVVRAAVADADTSQHDALARGHLSIAA
ncbi:MAG: hypothetical protein WAV28_00655, partial [Sedimentisphaerales bacterium]